MRRRLRLEGLALCAALAGCAAQPVIVIPNPDHLPEPAWRFSYVLDRGCYPVALGQKSEAAAMADVGLSRRHVMSFPDPPGRDHLYGDGSSGHAGTDIIGSMCLVRIRGDDRASFERAVRPIFARRSGADYAAHVRALDIPKGVFAFCVDGLMTKYYADQDLVLDKDSQRFSHPGYAVSVQPFDCAHFQDQMAHRAAAKP